MINDNLENKIQQFRKEFSINKKTFSDEEVVKSLEFLEEYAEKISPGNYKLKDGIIVQFGKIHGHVGYEKYVSEGDTRWVFFQSE